MLNNQKTEILRVQYPLVVVIFLDIKDVKELLNTAIEEAKNKLEKEEKKEIIDNNMRNFCKGSYQGLLEIYNKILEKESEEAKTEGKQMT